MAARDDRVVDTASRASGAGALARLFEGNGVAGEVERAFLPGGRVLYTAGQTADTLYFLKAGRLGVLRREEESGDQPFLGVVKPGEPVGEMALIAGTPHSATVVAIRDSEILALPREAFFAASRRDPALMAELAQLTVERSRQSLPRTGSQAPTTFAFIGVCETPVRALAAAVEAEIIALGFTVAVIGAEAMAAGPEWFSGMEDQHDVVMFAAEHDEAAWTRLCTRQVDRIFLVGSGERAPPPRPFAFAEQVFHEHRLMDVLLLHAADAARPQGSAAWLDAAPASRIFHLRQGDAAHLKRMARVLTGVSVGLVLSGGGARAYAHIGAVRALQEAGIAIDFIGGASMGAIIGAGLAAGWSLEQVTAEIRKAFVVSSPLADLALPMIAMTRGRLVHDRLKASFGDTDIEDLWLPFYCVSSNLTTGEPHLHRRGRLWEALRASSSLPGVLPPVIWGDEVLVDGAVTNNLPTDIMRRLHRGPVIGIDVAEARALHAQDVAPPKSLWRWLLSGDWKKGPPIVSLLIRAATVSSAHDRTPNLEACDLLVAPNIEGVELRDWKAFDPAVEAGYRAMKAALEDLEVPLTDLSRSPSRAAER